MAVAQRRRHQPDRKFDSRSVLHIWCAVRDRSRVRLPLQVGLASALRAGLTSSILGWSAFAGIVVLFVVAPLNSFLSKRSVKVGL